MSPLEALEDGEGPGVEQVLGSLLGSSVISVSSMTGALGPSDVQILGWQSYGCVHTEGGTPRASLLSLLALLMFSIASVSSC